jgi:plastocyanin
VVWRNPTNKTHTVTAYGRGWSKNVTLSPGERTRHTFRGTGTFKYRCTVEGHSDLSDGKCVGMCGKVRAH